MITWSYGVITVPSRRKDLLPKTLASLREGGFTHPHLFVDGEIDSYGYHNEFFGLPITARGIAARVVGNYCLALAELYVLNPICRRYAIFQDDIEVARNLKAYLDTQHYPARGYWNLYTREENLALANGTRGFYKSNQLGLGALALVFDRDTLIALLSSVHTLRRPTDPNRGHLAVDGMIVEALSHQLGYTEMVHNPSLVRHMGEVSTIGHIHGPRSIAASFPGVKFNALDLLSSAK